MIPVSANTPVRVDHVCAGMKRKQIVFSEVGCMFTARTTNNNLSLAVELLNATCYMFTNSLLTKSDCWAIRIQLIVNLKNNSNITSSKTHKNDWKSLKACFCSAEGNWHWGIRATPFIYK